VELRSNFVTDEIPLRQRPLPWLESRARYPTAVARFRYCGKSFSVIRISQRQSEERIASKLFGIQDLSTRARRTTYSVFGATQRIAPSALETEYHLNTTTHSRRLTTADLPYVSDLQTEKAIYIARFPAQQTDSIFGKTLYLNDGHIYSFHTNGYPIYFVARDDCFALIRRQLLRFSKHTRITM